MQSFLALWGVVALHIQQVGVSWVIQRNQMV
jgi:hypothetical protein